MTTDMKMVHELAGSWTPAAPSDREPDPGATNEHRAHQALVAVDAYILAREPDGLLGEPVDEQVTDLLTDLMHLCDLTGTDFDRQLQIARSHHSDEAVA